MSSRSASKSFDPTKAQVDRQRRRSGEGSLSKGKPDGRALLDVRPAERSVGAGRASGIGTLVPSCWRRGPGTCGGPRRAARRTAGRRPARRARAPARSAWRTSAPRCAAPRAATRPARAAHAHALTHSLTHRRQPRGGDASAEPYIKRRVARIYELRLSPTRRRRRDAKPEKQISETDDGVDRYRP